LNLYGDPPQSGAKIEKVESLVQRMCDRLGETYAGFHSAGPGSLDEEPGLEICFHTGDPNDFEKRLSGEGGMYFALVGSRYIEVRNAAEKFVARYDDLTQRDLA
jgi:hypothetical protein